MKISFRVVILSNVIFLYLLFSIIIFSVFMYYFSDEMKNSLIEENKYSLKVADDFMNEKLDVLQDKLYMIGSDSILRYSLLSNKYIMIPRTSTHSEPKTSKLSKYKLIKMLGEVYRKITRGAYKEYHFEYFDSDLKKQVSIGGFPKEYRNSSNENVVKEVFLSKEDYYLREIKTIEKVNETFLLRSFSNITFSGRNNGVAVISKMINEYFLLKIKKITNKEVVIVDNNKIVMSTFYKNSKMVKGVELKNIKNEINEVEIDGKSFLFSFIEIKNYKDENIGYLGLGYSTNKFEKMFKNKYLKILKYLLLSTLLLLLVFYLFLGALFNPFNKIINGIKEIEAGNYDKLIEVKSSGELSLIKENINKLSITVKNREKELINKNKLLEEAFIIQKRMEKERFETMINLSKAIVHEVKTPITVIRGYSSVIINKLHNVYTYFNSLGLNEKNKDFDKIGTYQEQINNETKRIDYLAKGLLEYAGKDQYKYKFSDFDLKTLIKDVIKRNDNEFKISKIKIVNEIDKNYFINADRDRMEKVFENIIKNSIENFDFKKEEIYINFKIKENEENMEIIIKDNGIGIDESLINDVFKPLVSTKIQGTGIGLAIVKTIIDKHNGEIEIESEKGEYTKVIIRLNKNL